jgi:hypothetical protein
MRKIGRDRLSGRPKSIIGFLKDKERSLTEHVAFDGSLDRRGILSTDGLTINEIWLHDLADEVIFVGLGDADVVDIADLRFKIFGHVVDQNVAVDLLSLSLQPPLKQEIRFLRQAPQRSPGMSCRSLRGSTVC